MNKEQTAIAELNKAAEKQRVERIRQLSEKLDNELQERLGTNFFAAYANGSVIIVEDNTIVAHIWRGFYRQLTENVVITVLTTEELSIILEISKLQK